MRETIRLHNPTQAWDAIRVLWVRLKAELMAGKRFVIDVRSDTRTAAQNRLMWSCLRDLSAQVEWFGKRLSDKGWKDFITAHLEGQELVPNMDGSGFVALGKGKSTSDMTIAEMTAVIDLAHAFGADKGVKWSETSIGRGME